LNELHSTEEKNAPTKLLLSVIMVEIAQTRTTFRIIQQKFEVRIDSLISSIDKGYKNRENLIKRKIMRKT
jgi:hypothetical protein